MFMLYNVPPAMPLQILNVMRLHACGLGGEDVTFGLQHASRDGLRQHTEGEELAMFVLWVSNGEACL